MAIIGKHNGSLKQKEKEYKRAWYLKNKELCRQRTRASRARRKAQGIEWYQLNKEKRDEYNRKHKLKLNYGISVEQYELLIDVQNGRCAICGDLPGKRRLAVDHNHQTGKIRGLLCHRCNTALGNLRENIDIMNKMIGYINKFNYDGNPD